MLETAGAARTMSGEGEREDEVFNVQRVRVGEGVDDGVLVLVVSPLTALLRRPTLVVIAVDEQEARHQILAILSSRRFLTCSNEARGARRNFHRLKADRQQRILSAAHVLRVL